MGVTAAVERINEIASTISTAIEEQRAATQEISSSVQCVAGATKQASDGTSVVGEATNETQSSVENLREAAQTLIEQSDTLSGKPVASSTRSALSDPCEEFRLGGSRER